MGIGACGNILSNPRGVPSEFKIVQEFETKSKRGDYRWCREDEILMVQ